MSSPKVEAQLNTALGPMHLMFAVTTLETSKVMVLGAHTAPFFATTPPMTIAVTTVSQDAQILLLAEYGATYMTAHLTLSLAQMLQHGLIPLLSY